MVNIEVKTRIITYSTNNDGKKLYILIDEALKNGNDVNVSFKGIDGLSSSFINSAFIELLNDYDFEYIKKKLIFSNSNKQINSLILSRFKFETEKCTA
ncbi:STAS-like domain-containing protein [Enterococcus sp. DIV0800]|uniref:STAS-like domain-containing protein n=1 Tax=unclassified Enterococcus TaxID=2608891 RepID=UPI003D300444